MPRILQGRQGDRVAAVEGERRAIAKEAAQGGVGWGRVTVPAWKPLVMCVI